MKDMKIRMMVRVNYDGDNYILGRVSGMLHALKGKEPMETHVFKNERYYVTRVYPWMFNRIKGMIESEYPGTCKFYN